MMRETTKIELPSGIVAELYTYITGRDRRNLMSVYLKENEEKGKLFLEAQDLAINSVIASITGKPDEVSLVDYVLDLRSTDYDFLLKKINEVTSDKAFEEKKNDLAFEYRRLTLGLDSDSDELFMLMICDKMKWTYQEYLSQPVWFLKGLNMLWNLKAKQLKDQNNGR